MANVKVWKLRLHLAAFFPEGKEKTVRVDLMEVWAALFCLPAPGSNTFTELYIYVSTLFRVNPTIFQCSLLGRPTGKQFSQALVPGKSTFS